MGLWDAEQREIEEAFKESWDSAENFFITLAHSPGWEGMKGAPILIQILRERGYNRQLRAGRWGVGFVVSRSREHGLRREQPYLAFDTLDRVGMTVSFEAASSFVRFNVDRVEITPQIEELLIPLLAYPID